MNQALEDMLRPYAPVNLPHLEARIRQSGNPAIEHLDLAGLQSLLSERFAKVDLAAAADEVRPYLRDARELALWSAAFFMELIPRLIPDLGEASLRRDRRRG